MGWEATEILANPDRKWHSILVQKILATGKKNFPTALSELAVGLSYPTG
jgi:hypothetical protein